MIRIAEEKNFENKIKKYLKDNGVWFVKFFANSYTKKGVPDILACVNGYFLGIEVKASRGTPSELQKYHVEKINESGGFAIILYPKNYDNFVDLVKCIKCNDLYSARKIVNEINERG